jgi:molybdopterin converting factor small subunit
MYVEFLGIPRARTGFDELEVEAETLGDLLLALTARFPALGDLMPAGALHPSIAVSLNGDVFVTDPATPLAEGDRVLILSSDAGG